MATEPTSDVTVVFSGIPLQEFLRQTKAQLMGGKSDQWLAHCPVHNDKKASLHVTLADKMLVNCFVCGGGDGYIEQLKQRQLWPILVTSQQLQTNVPREEVLEGLVETDEKPPRAPIPDKYEPVKIHEYKTRQGKLIGTVTRFEKPVALGEHHKPEKKFIPTFCFMRNGVPTWMHKGPALKPFYNLPSLSLSGAVILVEGEKTADAAQHAFPHNPVLSPMGGIQGFTRSDFKPLQGLKVVIWPDADPTWKENAEQWAMQLVHVAEEIKIVQLPRSLVDTYPKWDLADPIPSYVELVPRLFGEARKFSMSGTPAFDCITKAEDLRENYVAVLAGPNTMDFVHLSSNYSMSGAAFDSLFRQFTKPRFGQQPSAYLLEGLGMAKRRFASYAYEPLEPRVFSNPEKGHLSYNRWTKTALVPQVGDISVFLEHLEWLLNPEDRQELLCRLANMIQRPRRRPASVYLMQGRQGIGKNLIFNAFEKIVGHENYCVTEPASVLSGYNHFFANKILVLINEFTDFSKVEFLEQIKSFITEPKISIRQKYRDEIVVNSYAHIFGLTNQERPINIVEDDRRFYVARCLPLTPKSADYYIKLAKWMEDNVSFLLNFLLEFNIGEWNEKATPKMTAAKAKIIALSQSRALRTLGELILEGTEGPYKYSIYKHKEFMDIAKANDALIGGTQDQTREYLKKTFGSLIVNSTFVYVYQGHQTQKPHVPYIVLHPECLGDPSTHEAKFPVLYKYYKAERESGFGKDQTSDLL